MTQRARAKDGRGEPAKRMVAAGRKIDGVWQVKTFLRSAVNGTRPAFWEMFVPAAGARRRAR